MVLLHYTAISWLIQCVVSYERTFCFKRKRKEKGKFLNAERTWSWGGREDLGGVISRKNVTKNHIRNSQISKNIKKEYCLECFYVLWYTCVYAFMAKAKVRSYLSYYRRDTTFDLPHSSQVFQHGCAMCTLPTAWYWCHCGYYEGCTLRQERAPEDSSCWGRSRDAHHRGQLLWDQWARRCSTVDSSQRYRLKMLRCPHLTETAISTAPVGLLTAAVGWPGVGRRGQPLIWPPLRRTAQGLQRWQILEFLV